MTLKNEAVPMPDNRITYKNAPNGSVYVYYTIRAYRNKDGKPTSDEVSIGKKDISTGELIPNKRYFEIFKKEEAIKHHYVTPRSSQSCGSVAALAEIAKQTGLSVIMDRCFPDRWRQIILCASYIVCEGNVMMYISDWFDENKVDVSERLDDVECSRLFASITEKERTRFFTEWIKYHSEREYIAYDVTSISTYSNNIEIAEWGYNRDNDTLPQVNLGMFYGVPSNLPVYYDIYSGSIPDKSYLEYMMENAKDLGVRDVCFVMDRGFVTEDNFLCLSDKQDSFITAMPGHRIDALRLIDENKGNIRRSANRIAEFEIYGVRREIKMYGMDIQAHIFFNPEKQALDEKEVYARIDKLNRELEKMRHAKRIAKRYRDYFVIHKEETDVFTFDLDTEKVDAKLDRSGFFILLSSKPDLSCAEVLKIYRNRDIIEKNFDHFKNRLDFKRMRTHWTKTMEGKMFVGFLSLILRSYLQRLIKENSQTRHLTFEKVLLELKKIKVVSMINGDDVLIPLTKQQKTILAALHVPIEVLAPAAQ